MHSTSEAVKKRFPKLQVTWELLAYDAPGVVRLEMVDGRQKEFSIEYHSKYEMQVAIDEWQFEHHMRFMRERNMNEVEEE